MSKAIPSGTGQGSIRNIIKEETERNDFFAKDVRLFRKTSTSFPQNTYIFSGEHVHVFTTKYTSLYLYIKLDRQMKTSLLKEEEILFQLKGSRTPL